MPGVKTSIWFRRWNSHSHCTAIWVFSHLKIGRTNHTRSASFGQRLCLSKLLPLLIRKWHLGSGSHRQITKDFLACASHLSFGIIWMKMTSVQTKKHMNTVDMYDEAPNTSNSPPQQQHKKPFSNPNELYLWVFKDVFPSYHQWIG